VGVGGSGKQSLSRLAAFISTLEVFQITRRKGYGIPDLKLDLGMLYMKAGVKGIGIVLLMTDAQVSLLHSCCQHSNRKKLTLKCVFFTEITDTLARAHARTHTHIRFTIFLTLFGITRVSRYQNQSGFY